MKNMIKKIFLVSVIIASTLSAIAQDYSFWGQSYANRFSVSPAFAGLNGNSEAFLSSRRNMVGIDGGSKVMRLDVNGNMLQNSGFGVTIINDKSGNYSNLYSSISYAYHVKFSDDASLSFALSPALVRYSYNLTNAKTYGSQVDPIFQNEAGLSATNFDAGFGLVFKWTNLLFSVNIPRTICLDTKFVNGVYNFDRVFNGELSYAIESGKFLIEPIADISFAQKGGLDWRGALAAKYNQRAWIMASYSSQGWIGIGAGFAAGSRIAVNYQYEIGSTDLAKNCFGTHEITVGFRISKSNNRIEPTAFADDENSTSNTIIQTKNDNSDLERKLQEEIEMRDSEIKRLENMIQEYNSKLPNDNEPNTGLRNNRGNNTESVAQTNTEQPLPQIDDSPREHEVGGVNPDPGKWQDPIPFHSVNFGYSNDKLFSSSNSEIDKCVKSLNESSSQQILILAYTDEMGSDDFCLKLSQQRAEAIKTYITSKGVSANRVFTKGMGRKMFNGAEITPENRIDFNRVEYCWSK
ncbi:MAG: PorP/SprF family type IX secretion system membrane protein [Bacteroidales bacterium]|nr:PorP/SprF family type IX secretion system membrane protein [Bacteroidales bacterium]